MENIDIKHLLDKEIEKASTYFFPPNHQEENLQKTKLAYQIADEVYSKIKGKYGAFSVFNGLLGLLDTLSLEAFWANQIFNQINDSLLAEQREIKLNDDEFDNCSGLLFELKLTAVTYFKNKIYEEIKHKDFPKRLKLIKQTISEISVPEDKFKRIALKDIQEEIEREIELKKEEVRHRHDLEILSASQLSEDEEFTERSNEIEEKDTSPYKFDLKHKVPALMILLEFSGVKIVKQNYSTIARFIAAVTDNGYDNIYKMVCNGGFDKSMTADTQKKALIKLKDKFFALKSNAVRYVENRLTSKPTK